MRITFLKSGAAFFGSASLLALLAGIIGVQIALVDGSYYYQLHNKMTRCNEFVKSKLETENRFPDLEMMKSWSRENKVSPRLRLGGRVNQASFPNLEGHILILKETEYQIAYWDGHRFEFLSAWDGSFTTSIWTHSGKALLFGILSLGLGWFFWRIRRYLIQNPMPKPV